MFALLMLATLSVSAGEKLTLERATLTVDERLGLAGLATRVKACTLDNPEDMPAGLAPAHGLFVLAKDKNTLASYQDPAKAQCAFPMEGALHVVPVKELIATTSSAADGVAALSAQLATGVSRRRGAVFPFVPFVNAALEVSARPRKWKTATWSGIGFLALFSQEYATLDGRNVVYVFQALSTDQKTLVIGMFPVAYAQALPEYVPPKKKNANEELAWKNYTQRLDGELASAPAAAFVPSLSGIEATLGSLALK